jgi:hypothetical protein
MGRAEWTDENMDRRNTLLAVLCAGMLGLGIVLIAASGCAARVQGGWQPLSEDLDRMEMPLEWVAFGGMGLVLLAPLCFLAARASHHPDRPS